MAVGEVRIIAASVRPFTWGSNPAVPFATANGSSNAAAKMSPFTSFQFIGTTTSGNFTGTIQVQVTNDDNTALGNGTSWLNFGSALTITAQASGSTVGFPLTTSDPNEAVWKWVRVTLSALAGTGAQATVLMFG